MCKGAYALEHFCSPNRVIVSACKEARSCRQCSRAFVDIRRIARATRSASRMWQVSSDHSRAFVAPFGKLWRGIDLFSVRLVRHVGDVHTNEQYCLNVTRAYPVQRTKMLKCVHTLTLSFIHITSAFMH